MFSNSKNLTKNQSKWLKHYNKLIERSKNRNLTGYSEKHHIIPKCMGGDNSKSNIARLTPEEHYVAHQLLVKIFPNHNGLIWAVCYLTSKSKNRINNNKIFGWVRRKAAIAKSIIAEEKYQSIPIIHRNKILELYELGNTIPFIKDYLAKNGTVLSKSRILRICKRLYLEKYNVEMPYRRVQITQQIRDEMLKLYENGFSYAEIKTHFEKFNIFAAEQTIRGNIANSYKAKYNKPIPKSYDFPDEIKHLIFNLKNQKKSLIEITSEIKQTFPNLKFSSITPIYNCIKVFNTY